LFLTRRPANIHTALKKKKKKDYSEKHGFIAVMQRQMQVFIAYLNKL